MLGTPIPSASNPSASGCSPCSSSTSACISEMLKLVRGGPNILFIAPCSAEVEADADAKMEAEAEAPVEARADVSSTGTGSGCACAGFLSCSRFQTVARFDQRPEWDSIIA
jgi:hypothetical protein